MRHYGQYAASEVQTSELTQALLFRESTFLCWGSAKLTQGHQKEVCCGNLLVLVSVYTMMDEYIHFDR